MANPKKLIHLSIIAFAIGAGGAIPTEAHLLPAGEFAPTDGRKLPVPNFKLNADIAKAVIARLAARKNDTLIDYEHQSLYATENGHPVRAAGWFHEMEFRADGLWAINVDWTETAKRMIEEKEYRYISAVFEFDKTTGAVVDIISIALTNTPALDGLKSLAAFTKLNGTFNQQQDDSGDEPMELTKEEAIALKAERDTLKTNAVSLTAERDTLKTSNATLTTENVALKAQVTAAEAEKQTTALAAEKTKHTELVTTALSDGRLIPAQKAWAEKQSLAALTEYLEATNPLVTLGRQHKDGEQGAHGLSETELAMCSKMNVSPEDYIKNK